MKARNRAFCSVMCIHAGSIAHAEACTGKGRHSYKYFLHIVSTMAMATRKIFTAQLLQNPCKV